MALPMYCLAVDTALLSVVVNGVTLGAKELHLTSEYPTFSPETLAAADFRPNRSKISSSFNRTEVDGNSTTSEISGSGNVKDIWLIGLFPLKGSWAGGRGQLPAVEMGLEDVNADPNILPGYKLRMTMDDTEVCGCNNNNKLTTKKHSNLLQELCLFSDVCRKRKS